MYSTNFEDDGVISFTLNELEYDKQAGWANYVKGMILKLKEAGYTFDHGFELLVEGTIPNGAGLSSSASLELLVGVVLEDLFDLAIDRLALVQTGKKWRMNLSVSTQGSWINSQSALEKWTKRSYLIQIP